MKHQIGPGVRSVETHLTHIANAYFSGTPSAQRARAVVARRQKNWRNQPRVPDYPTGGALPVLKKGGGQIMTKKQVESYNKMIAGMGFPHKRISIHEVNTGTE